MTRSTVPHIQDADWLFSCQTQAVFAALSSAGHEARAVGGAVRNALLGRPVKDVDLATTAEPRDIISACEAAGLRTIPTGVNHGTVTVLSGDTSFEVTTLRKDVSTDGRHAEVAFTDDWVEDASRRDFTLNALYADADGRVFDPLSGFDDLKACRIRFIGDAGKRISEDYLRILRFFRFHAEYGRISDGFDADGLRACVLGRSGLQRLSAERIREEMVRLLAAPNAFWSVETLFAYGLLVDVLGAPPHLARLRHVVLAEEALCVSADPLRRLAALGLLVEEDAERLFERFRLSTSERRRLSGLVSTKASKFADLEEKGRRAALYRVGEQTYIDCMILSAADAGVTRDHKERRDWEEALALPQHWTPPKMPVSGRDAKALGVPEGPQLGDVLKDFEAWWVSADFPDDQDLIQSKLAAIARDYGA